MSEQTSHYSHQRWSKVMCEVLCVILCGVIWAHVRESIFGLYYSQRRGSHCHRVLLTFLRLSYLLDFCSRLPVAGGLRFIVYRIIFDAPCIVLWTRRYNTSCVKTSFVAYVVRSTPYILGDIIWTMTTWLVAWYNDKRCGRCVLYTDRYIP